jgi:hypothetical protein
MREMKTGNTTAGRLQCGSGGFHEYADAYLEHVSENIVRSLLSAFGEDDMGWSDMSTWHEGFLGISQMRESRYQMFPFGLFPRFLEPSEVRTDHALVSAELEVLSLKKQLKLTQKKLREALKC